MLTRSLALVDEFWSAICPRLLVSNSVSHYMSALLRARFLWTIESYRKRRSAVILGWNSHLKSHWASGRPHSSRKTNTFEGSSVAAYILIVRMCRRNDESTGANQLVDQVHPLMINSWLWTGDAKVHHKLTIEPLTNSSVLLFRRILKLWPRTK